MNLQRVLPLEVVEKKKENLNTTNLVRGSDFLQKRTGFKSEFSFEHRAASSRSVAKRMSEPFESCSFLKNLSLLHKGDKL
ncbi:MAG: hypothetical protein OXM55_07130 [Bdellovibrionales bacterium]|nr:hypothetical protein [Bdellovibrionales bacterium]